MQRAIWILCALLVLLSSQWAMAASIGPARIRLLEGEAYYRSPDVQEWQPATVNTPIDEGDTLWCPAGSRAELQIPDGALIRLDGGSQLDMLANENAFAHLHLASGRIYLRTGQVFKEGSLQIDADDTTVLPSGRTRLRIDMLSNSQEDVSIFKGSAYVEGNGSRTRVRAGEHIALEDGHSELLALNPPDSWEQWNMDRDRALSKISRSETYLPDELRSYSDELAQNGSWISTGDYGMVWRPTVVVSSDWAPYRSGRWMWRGNDYIWISYENWGWVPYHFGRWTVIGSYGWCWIPPLRGDVYWGPGYVGWYTIGDTIAWTPLAPGEFFYGYGNYGQFSVNVTNVVVNNTTIVYRNAGHRGGMSGVRRDDFVRGVYKPHTPPQDRKHIPVISAGSPRIPGIRDQRRGGDRRDTPPQRVEQRPAQPLPREMKSLPELQQRFPRISPRTIPGRTPGSTPGYVPERPAVQQPAGDTRQRTEPAVRQAQPERREIQQHSEPAVRIPSQPAPSQQPVYAPRTAPQRAGGQQPGAAQTRGERTGQSESQGRRVWRVTTPDHGK